MTAPRILAVDDCPADRAALRRAFEGIAPPVDLVLAESAAGALEWLSVSYPPHLLLVDVNMPGRSGLELLGDLKRSRVFREIPVWMLSASTDPRDVHAAYLGHASGFLRKPEDSTSLRGLAEILSRLCADWLVPPERRANPS